MVTVHVTFYISEVFLKLMQPTCFLPHGQKALYTVLYTSASHQHAQHVSPRAVLSRQLEILQTIQTFWCIIQSVPYPHMLLECR